MSLSTLLTANQIPQGKVYASLAAAIAAGGPTTTRSGATGTGRVSGIITDVGANLPRIWDGSLLVEPTAQNLIPRNTDLTASPWTTQMVGGGSITLTAGYAVAPDGNMTATRVQVSAIDSGKGADVYQFPVTVANTTQYTLSIYARATSGSAVLPFRIYNGATSTYAFAALTETWARYSITVTTAGTQATVAVGNYYSASGQSSVACDALVWGVQLELGGFATSVIKTAAAAVTRNTDICTLPTATWPTSKGTITWSCTPSFSSPYGTAAFQFTGRSGNNGIRCQKNSDDSIQTFVGANTFSSAPLSWVAGTAYVFKLKWNGTNTATLTRNGVVIASGAGGTFASWGLANAFLGSDGSGSLANGLFNSFKVE